MKIDSTRGCWLVVGHWSLAPCPWSLVLRMSIAIERRAVFDVLRNVFCSVSFGRENLYTFLATARMTRRIHEAWATFLRRTTRNYGMVLLPINGFKRVSDFRAMKGNGIPRNLFLMTSNRRQVFTARDNGIANDATTMAINSSYASFRFNNDLCHLFNRRHDRIITILIRQGASVIIERLVFLHLNNGLNRHLRHFCQVLSVNNFATRRRNVHAVVSNVNGIHCLHANKAQVKGRNVGRLYNGGRQLLNGGALTSRRALSTQGAFLQGFGARIATDCRRAINCFRSFVSVVGTFLILGLDRGASVTIVDIGGHLSIRCVLLVTRGKINGRICILLGNVGGVNTILLHREERVSTSTKGISTLTTTRDDLVLCFTRRMIKNLLCGGRLRIAIVGGSVTIRVRIFSRVKVKCQSAFANDLLLQITCRLRTITHLREGKLDRGHHTSLQSFHVRRSDSTIKGHARVICRLLNAFATGVYDVRACGVRAYVRRLLCGVGVATLIEGHYSGLHLLRWRGLCACFVWWSFGTSVTEQ